MSSQEHNAELATSDEALTADPEWLRPLRDEFPICRHAAYFQTGTLAPLARSVKQAVVEALEAEGDAGICGSAALADLFARAEAARAGLATFLGAGAEQLAWTGNTSLAIRYVLNAVRWQPGDRILLTDTEHVGTRNAVRALTECCGVEPVIVPAGSTQEQFLDALATTLAATDRLRLLFLSHVSCQDGRCLPVASAIDAAHAAGVPVALDGAQSAGQLPVDVGELGCDFFIGSGHKWLLGPHGTGYLYARDVASFSAPFSLVPENVLQGQSDGTPTMKPRLEIGTESVALKVGVGAAVRLLQSIGLTRAQDQVRHLTRMLRDGLARMPGVQLLAEGYASEMSGITAFVVDDLDVRTMRQLTDDLWEHAGVVVKTQLDNESIRVSIACFNTQREVQRLLDALPDSLARVRSR